MENSNERHIFIELLKQSICNETGSSFVYSYIYIIVFEMKTNKIRLGF